MESTINSYLNEDGEQKVFKTEIDFLYPPDAEQFFGFLSSIVKQSISWLVSALEIIKSEIKLHSGNKVKEMGSIAGKTNFNLKDESNYTFSEEEMRESIVSVIEKFREMGTDEKVIEFLENKILQ